MPDGTSPAVTCPPRPPAAVYRQLASELASLVPAERLVQDPLRTLAWGTDASFYRLVPQIVVKVDSESEVQSVLAACRRLGTPVTFRAAGTSLSGQAVTDSVLMVLGDRWDGVRIERDGAVVRLQPGVIGAEANRRLASYARKIGPDPASIDSAKIGGITANNSSGMCCGTSDNSYKTLLSMRLVLADGTLVDTGDEASVAAFRHSHGALLAALEKMGEATRRNEALADRIRRKFAIKNTTGYSLNALVDYTDPLEILQHLMVGSEGTLGFIAEVTCRTVPDHAHKASALALFADIGQACKAVALLKKAPVSAVELMDRAALRSVEDKPGMPASIQGLADGVTALLIETRAGDADGLQDAISEILSVLGDTCPLGEVSFTTDPAEYGKLWKIRKGLFPAVGAVRKTGTTVIIEDVAFRIEDLAAATLDLQALLKKHRYDEAIIFGHALDGNLHFVFTQDFSTDSEVLRYADFMDDVCHLVVDRYDGSLKAEHGTGRNMAPFVEMEWGSEAWNLMRQLKNLLDPAGLLNPGVILDSNPQAHLDNLKALPPADPLVDTCIECGFCERMCPSHGLTLSPRQRIVGWREISRASRSGENPQQLDTLKKLYDYQGIDTCAACGLCSLACPVGIETGLLTKALRGRRLKGWQKSAGAWVAGHFSTTLGLARGGLKLAQVADSLLGKGRSGRIAGLKATLPPAGRPCPVSVPTPDSPAMAATGTSKETTPPTVVYVPGCANRTFGPTAGSSEGEALPQVFFRLAERAGFRVIVPDNINDLCCGQSWETKGMMELANQKSSEFEQAVRQASENGRWPVVMDTSACTFRLKRVFAPDLTILDSIEFAHDMLLPRLTVSRQPGPVLIHLNCSARRMDLEGKLKALAAACADQVEMPPAIGCCGFAGDKGFTTPELNDHALRRLPEAVPDGCTSGYSSNRTCEIGLADHSGIPYKPVLSLLEVASRRS